MAAAVWMDAFPAHAALPRLATLLLAAAFGVSGCSTVDEGDGGPRAIAPLDVQVSIAPAEVQLHATGSIRFVATVEGDPSDAVVWSVAEGPAGGSIDADGIYTAPASHGSFTVIATSRANRWREAKAQVHVGEIVITVSPGLIELPQGATLALEATVEGSWDTSITWTAEAGEISPAGIYSVPHREGTFDVIATSNADPRKSAKAEVIVQELLLAMDPWSATIDQGASVQLAAVLQGTTDPRVIWSADEFGTVDEDGLYTAPFRAGTFPVRATSVSNPRKNAAASITVREASIAMEPWWIELDQGASHQFGATLAGTADQRIVWSTSGGAISEAGFFTAPHAPGDAIVTATSAADPSAMGRATVQVREILVSLEPGWVQLFPGAGTTFVATVRGSIDSAVEWSADGGSIDPAGFYTAPLEPGSYLVHARAAADPGRMATAAVHIVAPPSALAYDNPQAAEDRWRLVSNEEAGSATRRVLELRGPAGAAREGISLELNVDPPARWVAPAGDARADELVIAADGRVLRLGARGDEGSLSIEVEADPDDLRLPGGSLLSIAIESPLGFGAGPLDLDLRLHAEGTGGNSRALELLVGTLRLE